MFLDKNDILAAYQYRHACKKYDSSKKISDEDFRFILETARLSPSSFGFEPWKFLVIESPAIRQMIRETAWGAGDKAIECSHFIVILARTASTMLPDGKHVSRMMSEIHHLDSEIIATRREYYRNFIENDFALAHNPTAFNAWACRQTYIALGNMLTAAAMIGIDSTAIEGFPMQKMSEQFIASGLYNPEEWQLSVMAAFGYRLNEPRAKTRQSLDEIVEWIK